MRGETSEHLQKVLDSASTAAMSLKIPSQMIDLHREVERSARQQALRWGAFLLIYAPIEGFFNEILTSEESNRVVPLNSDKLRDRALKLHQVHLFQSSWSLRTRGPSVRAGGRSKWILYETTAEVRHYLADMKSLRDLLSHGGNPYNATNLSSSLWRVHDGWSMRIMGVEGFLQAACDLMDQTIVAYGGGFGQISWPTPIRSGLSARPMPALS